MIGITNFNDSSLIIHDIVRLLNKNKLNDAQKEILFKVVNNVKCSDIHKIRFSLYYGLNPKDNKIYSLNEVAEMQKVSTSSIRGSINMFKYKLCHITESDIQLLKNILEEYHNSIGIPQVRFKPQRRVEIVDRLLEISKQNLLNTEQKSKIRTIVNSMSKRTENQRNRFILYYNLIPTETKARLCDLAKACNCSTSAIRSSVMRIRNNLIHVENEDMFILQTILEDCIKEHNIKFIDE